MKTINKLIILLSIVTLISCGKENITAPILPEESIEEDVIDSLGVIEFEEVNIPKLYTFFSHDFRFGFEKAQNIVTTKDTITNSLWLVYLVSLSGSVHAIPGSGYNSMSNYTYTKQIQDDNSTLSIIVSKLDGPGELYSNIRVVRIYTNLIENIGKPGSAMTIEESLHLNDLEKAKRFYPTVDFNDYNSVKSAFKF